MGSCRCLFLLLQRIRHSQISIPRLAVAIPAVASNNYFQRLIKSTLANTEALTQQINYAFIDRGLYGTEATPGEHRQPIGAFVAAVFTLRKWTVGWMRSLPEADWKRTALHPQRGEQTLRRILEYATWHLEHHAWFLRAKVERFASGK